MAEILFGEVNPSGKLPVTFEKKISDNPAYATFPKAINTHPDASRSQGIFIGYRGYEHNHTEPLFPFGFGLSYTKFAYSDIKIEPEVFNGSDPVKVSFKVTNTGKRGGAEVAELYVGQENPKSLANQGAQGLRKGFSEARTIPNRYHRSRPAFVCLFQYVNRKMGCYGRCLQSSGRRLIK